MISKCGTDMDPVKERLKETGHLSEESGKKHFRTSEEIAGALP